MHGNTPSRKGAGRPTKEQAEARFEELLDTALDLFLQYGYELTTIEMIASVMSMTKRTVYAKFEDKSALFLAAVQRAIERQIVPQAELEQLDSGDLAGTLEAIGRLRINQIRTPAGMRLQHIIQSESYRFPQIFEANFQQSAKPVMDFIAELLDRAAARGDIAVSDTKMVASAFMSMVVGGQVRTIVGGMSLNDEEIEANVKFTVGLLLNGLRPR